LSDVGSSVRVTLVAVVSSAPQLGRVERLNILEPRTRLGAVVNDRIIGANHIDG